MNEKRYAGRVGLFVFVGIVLIAGLMLNFSRGVGLFKPKYDLHMRVRSVAGLKPRSNVYLSGVQIGNVASVELDQKNRGAVVHLKMHKDAKFVIEQIGVLGDQFVIVYPGTPGAAVLNDEDEVQGEEPFNLQEVARSTSDLLKRFDQLGATVSAAISRVNDQILDGRTLSNFSLTVDHFEKISGNALLMIDNASGIISNAGPVLTLSLTNLLGFSRKLEKVAMEVDEAIVTNRVELNESMKNLRDATASLKQMTADMQSGKGLVGGLLKDDELRAQMSVTISNLALLSSNLNRYGLLYKPKLPKESHSVYPGKSGK